MKSVEEYSSQDISLMEFREKLFLEEMERYTTAITGERESILPFVRDESGHYSEEKTWAFDPGADPLRPYLLGVL